MRFLPVLALGFCGFLLFFSSFTSGTLSKSDRKRSKNHKPVEKAKNEEKRKVVEQVQQQQQNEQTKKVERDEPNLKEKILTGHNKLDTGERKFNGGITLGYVTPWNNHGYDVAKWAANKFTHISPVWFQLRPGEIDDGQLTCYVGGTHDIDMGWIEEILQNNSLVRIVPRFIFEGWNGPLLDQFLNDEEAQYRCIRGLTDFLQRHNFNGAIMELWLQFMSITHGSAVDLLLELVEFWSEHFRSADLLFILPLTPPLGADLQEIGFVNSEILRRLFAAVDYINLMTYDFPGMAGVAPIGWVEANLRYAIENSGESEASTSKLLMGLNFYGYARSGRNNEAVMGKKFIELLSLPEARLRFDSDIGEHMLIFGSNEIVYYPSRRSIQLRLQLAREMGLGGVAIWDLGQGLDHFTSVL